MGAATFYTESSGKTANEAFTNAVNNAAYESGHGGYTGTIAEKDSFTLIEIPEGKEPMQYVEDLIDEADERIDDKWGPAGCIQLEDGLYLFFGWASS